MSAEKKYTERDLVMAKRAGFVLGWSWSTPYGDASRAAESHIPLPKVTRPRVVTYQEGAYQNAYCLIDEQLYTRPCTRTGYKSRDDGWERFYVTSFTDEIRTLLLDLLANPTEEVEDA